jgi:hypothetical protein
MMWTFLIVDNVLPAVLRQAGVLKVSTKLGALLDAEKTLTDGTSLRHCCVCPNCLLILCLSSVNGMCIALWCSGSH